MWIKTRSWFRALKKLGSRLKQIKNKKYSKGSFDSVNLYFQDESRFGLMTHQKRVLTARGVKPVCRYQHRFENLWLYGCFSPVNGDSFLLELPYCNTDMFQLFLDEFAIQKRTEFKIMILDNAAFHKAKRLKIPDNIALLFLPAYSPELNPAERIWRYIKDHISMRTFDKMEDLQKILSKVINERLIQETVISITKQQLYNKQFNGKFRGKTNV